MRIEFLDDVGRDVPTDKILRLFDFGPEEAGKFQNVIKELVRGGKDVHLHELSFIEPVNCSLTLVIGDEDQGIHLIEKNEFKCTLTRSSFMEMILLIQNFVDNDSDGYQWLYDVADNEIDFLFSPGGTW